MEKDNKRQSCIIYNAVPQGDSNKSRIWKPNGNFVQHKNSEAGLFEHAFDVGAIDISGIAAGSKHPGYAGISVKDADEQAFQQVETLRLGKEEIVAVYRAYHLEEGIYESKECVVLWGYIVNATARANGPSSIGFEVHCMRRKIQNDLGTTDKSIDCISGAAGANIGARTPQLLNPIGTAQSENYVLTV